MSEDYLATAQSFRAYLDSLPDVGEEDVYCVEIVSEEYTDTHMLVMAMTDSDAIESFDVTFLEVHRELDKYADAKYMRVIAPADAEGVRRELARISLEEM